MEIWDMTAKAAVCCKDHRRLLTTFVPPKAPAPGIFVLWSLAVSSLVLVCTALQQLELKQPRLRVFYNSTKRVVKGASVYRLMLCQRARMRQSGPFAHVRMRPVH